MDNREIDHLPNKMRNMSRLDTSSLHTFMYKAMAIMNNRPIASHNSNQSDDPEILCPNNVLTTKPQVVLLPPGAFVKEDVYLATRWRRVQHLLQESWRKWSKEYLLNQQKPHKWTQTCTPLPTLDSETFALFFIEALRDKSAIAALTEANKSNTNEIADMVILKLGTRVKYLEEELKSTKKELKEVREMVNELEGKADDQEQYSRRTSIRITGLPENNDENVPDLVIL
ncbi:hypothetical protein CAPTEDRAFT_204432 [Capitella teleta]|uniref:DUF5641 domain-containing protein n=1 Tax=Capitella teleta TaxID=283909 RepID=R7VG99_CAPTE|nr:hypothetical protein CAPTEDRAFT_204432 [Capitella teleta]|eukprot:ELU14690.1 hypothetical protein CAPTEDRAFT_204432 [Capitella teleta]